MKLSASERLVYTTLKSRANEDGRVYLKQTEIAEECGVSIRSVRNCVHVLEQNSYVNRIPCSRSGLIVIDKDTSLEITRNRSSYQPKKSNNNGCREPAKFAGSRYPSLKEIIIEETANPKTVFDRSEDELTKARDFVSRRVNTDATKRFIKNNFDSHYEKMIGYWPAVLAHEKFRNPAYYPARDNEITIGKVMQGWLDKGYLVSEIVAAVDIHLKMIADPETAGEMNSPKAFVSRMIEKWRKNSDGRHGREAIKPLAQGEYAKRAGEFADILGEL